MKMIIISNWEKGDDKAFNREVRKKVQKEVQNMPDRWVNK